MNEDRLGEVQCALEERGWRWRRLLVLTAPGVGRKRGRQTFRVDLVDGSTIKARCLESRAAAERLRALRSGLGRTFVPIIASDDAVLFEEWVVGTTPSIDEADGRAQAFGALLGQLHATPCEGHGNPLRTELPLRRADEHMKQLAASGVLPTDVGDLLRAQLVLSDPGERPQSLIHLDYCPENVIVDAADGIHVIDNEWISIGAPGSDLARTWSRWPMTGEVWRRFLEGYASTSPFNPDPLRFWMIAMAAAGAAIRMQTHGDASLAVARLRELAVSTY